MSRRFRPEPEASAELEHAALWCEDERPGLGADFLDAIDAHTRANRRVARRCAPCSRLAPTCPRATFRSLAFRTTSPTR